MMSLPDNQVPFPIHPFSLCSIILTIFWLIQHTLHTKICWTFEHLHVSPSDYILAPRSLMTQSTWRIHRARSASNVTHFYGCLFGAGDFLSTMASQEWCFSDLKTWRPVSPSMNNPRKELHRSYAFHDVALEVT